MQTCAKGGTETMDSEGDERRADRLTLAGELEQLISKFEAETLAL